MDNNATGCYNRIVVSLEIMACCHLGMPANEIRTQTGALQFMKYTVKTVYGISEDNYKGTSFEPLLELVKEVDHHQQYGWHWWLSY